MGVGVVVRRYIDFLILLIPTHSSCIYLFFFAAASLLFVHLKKMFFVLYIYNYILFISFVPFHSPIIIYLKSTFNCVY